jgi:hypothetical protein
LKLDKFNVVSLEQLSNILCISVTLEVLKLDKSNEERLEQNVNIIDISVTLEVSKLDKSIEVRLVRKANIVSILVTPLHVTVAWPDTDSSVLVTLLLSFHDKNPLAYHGALPLAIYI